MRFDPLATAIGVFFAIAIPVFVLGYTRPTGTNVTIIVIGVITGLAAAVVVGIWLAGRDGRVWRDPRL
jgi:predicted benzoate:H+ symporter BenE